MSTTAVSENSANPRVYLDYAAATPLSPAARRAMESAAGLWGNPSSIHEDGRRAQAVLRDARGRIARVLGAAPERIIFTGSGSEADAFALAGAARAHRAHGAHIIVSSIEHKAILRTARLLEEEGFEVTYLRPDADGRISSAGLSAELREDTILVSIMYANNEIGTVEPVQELARTIRAYRKNRPIPLFHTDACQAPGQLPLDVEMLGADLLSINSSKTYGPKGIGALYVRDAVALTPIAPGEQERGLRGGTENVELAAGFAAALEEAEGLRKTEAPRLAQLRDFLFEEIERLIPEVVINGHRTERLPNNVHVSLPGIEGESILLMLDAVGISCATGSACNSLDLAPSHVLLAIGTEAGLSHGSIRFSLGRDTTEEDVRRAASELARITSLLRGVSALTLPQRV